MPVVFQIGREGVGQAGFDCELGGGTGKDGGGVGFKWGVGGGRDDLEVLRRGGTLCGSYLVQSHH